MRHVKFLALKEKPCINFTFFCLFIF